ncbi:hypothetical protein JN11_02812 [Mucilaginibacter frigoritolerans]|uniref:Uncharacterized protein n=1 Tax=Mucilaginibacter frigoritolerans TaxID=652788 RepID=A0A562TZU8_9SPHI|nr:hypothetical protein [Mucilaginibacter frigoritolerans]TWI98624.1 hypothetical protein JN11_02812 [Mucilaginibacter frigoritolerans]
MNIYKYGFFLYLFGIGLCYGQTKLTINTTIGSYMQKQADIMGKVFLKGDYQTFAKYTYPAIVNAMGGEIRMATVLANSASSMKTQGMTFDNITFDSPSKIVKSGNELQCTLQQHTTIKLVNGRAVATSTLIAISKDGGKNWLFVDTSNKDVATMRKALPNLSTAIIIPPQQKPAFYSF